MVSPCWAQTQDGFTYQHKAINPRHPPRKRGIQQKDLISCMLQCVDKSGSCTFAVE